MKSAPAFLALALALTGCSDPQTTADVPPATDVTTTDVTTTDATATDNGGADVPISTDVSSDGTTDAPRDATATDALADAATDALTDAATDGGRDGAAMDASAPMGLVVNEIRASGDDWIELYNNGTTPVDLSGAGVADTDTDGGVPRVAQAVRFPMGTSLMAGQYLFVLANVADAGTGPQTSCLDGGPTMCFHAPWGISASRGETVWVIGASNEVLTSGTFPPNAVVDGQSYGRLPNGTGAFAANRPTPGGPNSAP